MYKSELISSNGIAFDVEMRYSWTFVCSIFNFYYTSYPIIRSHIIAFFLGLMNASFMNLTIPLIVGTRTKVMNNALNTNFDSVVSCVWHIRSYDTFVLIQLARNDETQNSKTCEISSSSYTFMSGSEEKLKLPPIVDQFL